MMVYSADHWTRDSGPETRVDLSRKFDALQLDSDSEGNDLKLDSDLEDNDLKLDSTWDKMPWVTWDRLVFL